MGKVTNFTKYDFLKKGVDGFSKKLCFCNHQDVSFQKTYFTCKDVFDPFQRTVACAECECKSDVCHPQFAFAAQKMNHPAWYVALAVSHGYKWRPLKPQVFRIGRLSAVYMSDSYADDWNTWRHGLKVTLATRPKIYK